MAKVRLRDMCKIEIGTEELPNVQFGFNDNISGILEAYDDIQSLTKMKDILKDKEITNDTVKLVKISTESITNKLNIYSPKFSLESVNESNKLTICTETIMDTIKRIWEAIKNTFKAIWDKIASYFTTSKVNVEYMKVKCAAVKHRLDETIKKADGNEKVKADKPYEDASKYLGPLNYHNKELHFQDFIDTLRKLEDHEKVLNGFIIAVELANQNAKALICGANDAAGLIVDYKRLSDHIANPIYANVDTYIESNFTKEASNTLTEDMFTSGIDITKNEVKSSSLKSMGEFIYGGKIYFFRSIKDEDLRHYMLIHKKDTSDATCKFKMIELNDIPHMYDCVRRLVDKLEDLVKAYSGKFEVIKKLNQQMNGSIEHILADKDNKNNDELIASFTIIKDLVRSLLDLGSKTGQGFSLYDNTVSYYVELLDHFEYYYSR